MKFAIKPMRQCPSHLRHVPTLKIKKIKFSADVEETANKLHF